MTDIVGSARGQFMKDLLLIVFIIAASQQVRAQVYVPVFKSVEMQATIAPLGEMVEGDFFGKPSIAAVSESEKAIYFFEPDSMENLILTNVVSLPDTPVAISKGKEVLIQASGKRKRFSELAVLMKPDYVALVSFGRDGQPEISALSKVDPYCTGVRAVDMETAGKLDLVAFGKFSLGVSIEKNAGRGRFREVKELPGPLGNVPFSDIKFTDFNGDLVPDMAALDWVNRRLLIFYGRGDGTFAKPVSFQLKAEPSTLSVADLNGNGYPDIVVGYTRLSEIDIFGGDGFGRFFLQQTIKTQAPVSSFAIADFTGDGTMDIAALSRESGQIMLFSYDPLSRRFEYSGAVGAGNKYENILPFYFANRIKADLIATSPDEKVIKVFKSAVLFQRSPDRFVPVSSHSRFVSVCGSDTGNYLITGNSSGRITARFSSGLRLADAQSAVDWQSEGTGLSARLLSQSDPYLLVSYADADVLSLYEVFPRGRGVADLNAETAFPPFAAGGEAAADSASIAAAYRSRPDSTVGIAHFTTVGGRSEFLEHDYSVADSDSSISALIAVAPKLRFLRAWRVSADSIDIASAEPGTGISSKMPIAAVDVRFLDTPGGRSPLLAVQRPDTLVVYSIRFGPLDDMVLDRLCSTPFDSANFSSVRLAARGSTYYLTYFNRTGKSVFLYAVAEGRMRFVKAWRIGYKPSGIAVSVPMKRVYFLNSSEAYVSVHDF